MDQWPDEPFTRGERSDVDLRRGVRRGEIRPVVRGVYVASHVTDSLELRAKAVATVLPAHHVVTDRTAAWLHGVDTHVYAEHDVGPEVEACALRGHEPTGLAGVDGRTRDLRAEDVEVLHGVPVTTPLRTALDLGCCLRRREAFAALNALARAFKMTSADFKRALPRYRRRRGVVQLRGLVGLVDPRIESPREAWVLLAIVDAGLPAPEPQVWVTDEGVPRYRLDLAYRRLKVCVEYDGDEAHSTPAQREHDEERRRWLRANGWTVIVVRNGGFTGAALDRWLAELRRALVPSYTNRRW
jgi:hypothetical protein